MRRANRRTINPRVSNKTTSGYWRMPFQLGATTACVPWRTLQHTDSGRPGSGKTNALATILYTTLA